MAAASALVWGQGGGDAFRHHISPLRKGRSALLVTVGFLRTSRDATFYVSVFLCVAMLTKENAYGRQPHQS